MTSVLPQSMKTFYLVWFGQMISLIGSNLTSFGLGVWVFQRTGSATQFGLIAVTAILPGILIVFFALQRYFVASMTAGAVKQQAVSPV